MFGKAVGVVNDNAGSGCQCLAQLIVEDAINFIGIPEHSGISIQLLANVIRR